MIKKIVFIFLISILTACMPPKAISKKDVNIAVSQSRKDVLELKNKNQLFIYSPGDDKLRFLWQDNTFTLSAETK